MAAEYQYIPIVYKQKKAVSNRYANNRQAIYAQIDQYHAVKKTNVKKSAVKSKPVKSVKTKVKKPAKARNGRSAFVAVVAAAGLSNPTYAEPVVTAVDRTLERPEKKEKVKIKVRKGLEQSCSTSHSWTHADRRNVLMISLSVQSRYVCRECTEGSEHWRLTWIARASANCS